MSCNTAFKTQKSKLRCERNHITKNGEFASNNVGQAQSEYACSLCDKSYQNKNSLKAHAINHTREKYIACNLCEMRFFFKALWRSHQKTHTGEKPEACPKCNKKFTIQYDVKRHMRIHTGERPFSCKVCKRSFNIPEIWSDTELHIRQKTCLSVISERNPLDLKLKWRGIWRYIQVNILSNAQNVERVSQSQEI